jgi:hypothetical protein
VPSQKEDCSNGGKWQSWPPVQWEDCGFLEDMISIVRAASRHKLSRGLQNLTWWTQPRKTCRIRYRLKSSRPPTTTFCNSTTLTNTVPRKIRCYINDHPDNDPAKQRFQQCTAVVQSFVVEGCRRNLPWAFAAMHKTRWPKRRTGNPPPLFSNLG